MSIRCIILEDQPLAQQVLLRYIDDCPQLELVGTFFDPLKALSFLKNESVDVVFLDIHLPKLSGLEFLNVLEEKPQVILTTAFSEYALESYELDAVDYLLKPFSFERFLKAINKIKEPNNNPVGITPPLEEDQNFAFVKLGHDHVRITFSDILFIRSERDYTKVLMKNAKYLVSQPLKYWIEKLPDTQFCQVHKSYLVNVYKVDKVIGNQLVIEKEMIPIGRVFKENFTKKYIEN